MYLVHCVSENDATVIMFNCILVIMTMMMINAAQCCCFCGPFFLYFSLKTRFSSYLLFQRLGLFNFNKTFSSQYKNCKFKMLPIKLYGIWHLVSRISIHHRGSINTHTHKNSTQIMKKINSLLTVSVITYSIMLHIFYHVYKRFFLIWG